MKTIKSIVERAEDYINRHKSLQFTRFLAYTKGATEQKEIDIDKACEWLKNNAVVCLMDEEVDDFIDDFREAMKEE